MTRFFPPQHITENLKRHLGRLHPWYMEYEEAHKQAIRYSGLDFGDNILKWDDWFEKYPNGVGKVYSTASLRIQCELLTKNLRAEISPKNYDEFVAPEHALALLTQKTSKNFGENSDKWDEWIKANLSENNDE